MGLMDLSKNQPWKQPQQFQHANAHLLFIYVDNNGQGNNKLHEEQMTFVEISFKLIVKGTVQLKIIHRTCCEQFYVGRKVVPVSKKSSSYLKRLTTRSVDYLE